MQPRLYDAPRGTSRLLALAAVLACTSPVLFSVTAQQPSAAAPSVPTPAAGGAIAGQVLEKDSGRPVPFPMLDIIGGTLGAQGDAEGRFRITGVPAGMHRLRARRLGYLPVTDSVRVADGETTTHDFTLGTAVTQLEATRVQGAANRGSEAGMMELQRSAAAVMDGMSSEAMARAPGANAAEAITRLTGISVVDRKFTVVRGLPERYNNTQLNGVDLPSPEPLRKIVPLDIFPSSLLESIVASKTATPDKPGDFAGGSVEIRTKEFPSRRVVQMNVSQDFNSLTTFNDVSYVPRTGIAMLGFSGSARRAPSRPGSGASNDSFERFAESIRNVWTPKARSAPPGLGLGLSAGDRKGPLGYTVSLAYSTRIDYQPGRLYQFVADKEQGVADRGFVARESQSVVDWGATANVSVQAGRSAKFGWKNLYTRNAEEYIALNDAFETHRGNERVRAYQVRFVERELMQTQLTGDHTLGFLRNARFEWKATAARASRDEPDNRSATYVEDANTGVFAMQPANQTYLWFRFLDDAVLTGHADLSTPIKLWGGREMLFKTGGMYRQKDRRFAADVFTYRPSSTPPSGSDVFSLPPEQAFSPEHVGTFPNADIALARLDALALPYRSADDLGAFYGMVDVSLFRWLRIVGGARAEHWMLDVRPASGIAVLDSVTLRRERDVLGSVNLTLALTDRMNVRLAGYQTVGRPDPRELTNDYYTPVSGECGNQGNDQLRHTRINNADFRWEFYPDADELIAVSGFFKQFRLPVIEVVSLPQANLCIAYYVNAESATNTGGEVEIRKSLGWVPFVSDGVSANVNVTIVQTEALLGERFQNIKTQFQGQSPYVVNAGLMYQSADDRITLSVLVNAFGDRITRYGATSLDAATGQVFQIPHVNERARVTLDAKLQARFRSRVSWSVSAKNLTNQAQRFYQDSDIGRVRTGFIRTGVSVKIGAGFEL